MTPEMLAELLRENFSLQVDHISTGFSSHQKIRVSLVMKKPPENAVNQGIVFMTDCYLE